MLNITQLKRLSLVTVLSFATFLLGVSASSAQTPYSAANTQLVSRGTYTSAPESDGDSYEPRVSKNGRFVVFTSTAGNLVTAPSTTTGRQHVYLFDRQAGTVELVSQTYTQVEAPVDCYHPAVSNDGRYVSFTCSTMLVNDVTAMVQTGIDSTNHLNIAFAGQHIYIRDRLANATLIATQVSLPVKQQAVDDFGVPAHENDPNNPGTQRPIMTTVTYRIAAFRWNTQGESGCIPNALSDTNFVYCPALSDNARLSGDGRYTVFDTDANNLAFFPALASVYPSLVPGTDYNATTGIVNGNRRFFPEAYFVDGTDAVRDIYVRDGSDNTNRMVSLFCQYYDPTLCPVQSTVDSFKPSISDDGKYITFHSASPFLSLDFNGTSDVFLVERSDINGEVAKLSRVSNNTTRILAANGSSTNAMLSADGRYVAFESTATDLVTGDTNGQSDIFVYDHNFNNTLLCSKNASTQANSGSFNASISGSGEYISFNSAATNLGLNATASNVYIAKTSRDSSGKLTGCTITPASVGATGTGANGASTISSVALVPETSSTGQRALRSSIVYQSAGTNLTSGSDTNGLLDIFQAPTCNNIDANTDTDGDGTTDCFDQCVNDPIKVEDFDTDGDGYADCEDGCKTDPQKQDPGVCGCGVQDVDTDGDGTFDCKDTCPNDPNKIAPGSCGCGRVDVDANHNGIMDCLETTLPPAVTPTPGSVPATPVPGITPRPTDYLSAFRNFTPPAPKVSRQASGYINVKYNFDGVPGGIEVTDLKLTVTKAGTRQSATVKNAYYGKKLKLPAGFTSGKMQFSVVYKATIGSVSASSKTSSKSGQVSVSSLSVRR